MQDETEEVILEPVADGSSAEVAIFECGNCSFASASGAEVRQHVADAHGHPSQEQLLQPDNNTPVTFQCQFCNDKIRPGLNVLEKSFKKGHRSRSDPLPHLGSRSRSYPGPQKRI